MKFIKDNWATLLIVGAIVVSLFIWLRIEQNHSAGLRTELGMLEDDYDEILIKEKFWKEQALKNAEERVKFEKKYDSIEKILSQTDTFERISKKYIPVYKDLEETVKDPNMITDWWNGYFKSMEQ